MNTERERFIRDPNSREAKLIADWDKAKGTLKTDEGIPQLYISGWIDGHESQSATIADLQQQLTEANGRGEELAQRIKLLERQVSVCFHAGSSLYRYGSNLGEFLRRLQELESKLFSDPILSPAATSKRGGE